MEIIEVSKEVFQNTISKPYHVFDTAEFNDLNKHKCEEVVYLLFKEHKIRLGIIGGLKNKTFKSSFSAPFGGFSYIDSHIRISFVDSALDLLIDWCKQHELECLNITLPPSIYNQSFITKQVNSLYRKNFDFAKVELNYVFYAKNLNENYIQNLNRKTRANLKQAFKQNLRFYHCENQSENKQAYDVIREHKKTQGYPIKLSWKDVVNTTAFINADFFLLYNMEEIPIASAIVFYVSAAIVQIIYWGDIRKYSNLRPMNYLSYKIFEYYKNQGIKVIDLGPSSENSIPNYGLCNFKEGIGCDITTKFNLELRLNY